MSDNTAQIVVALATELTAGNWRLALAESCTGGLMAKYCTDLPGSSSWFDCALVTYSNASKTALLGVSPRVLNEFAAVSREVVEAMASGVLKVSAADFAIAVSGVAGPDGGSADKPVGTVWLAFAAPGRMHSERRHFIGDRQAVREATAQYALQNLLGLVREARAENTRRAR